MSKFFLTDLTREQKAIEIKNIHEGNCALFGVIKIKVYEPKGIPDWFHTIKTYLQDRSLVVTEFLKSTVDPEDGQIPFQDSSKRCYYSINPYKSVLSHFLKFRQLDKYLIWDSQYGIEPNTKLYPSKANPRFAELQQLKVAYEKVCIKSSQVRFSKIAKDLSPDESPNSSVKMEALTKLVESTISKVTTEVDHILRPSAKYLGNVVVNYLKYMSAHARSHRT